MARFYGAIGYGESVEVVGQPGVWADVIVEHMAYGDILRNTRQLREGDKVNDDITVANSISIVADAYAREHFFNIKYVKWSGALWKVTEVEVQSPRLLLRLGEVYDGPVVTPDAP